MQGPKSGDVVDDIRRIGSLGLLNQSHIVLRTNFIRTSEVFENRLLLKPDSTASACSSGESHGPDSREGDCVCEKFSHRMLHSYSQGK